MKESIVHKAGFFTLAALLLFAVGGAVVRFFSHEIPTSFFVVGLILIFAAAFAAFLFAVALPLHELSKQVHALLSGGRYRRLPPRSVDEIGLMAHFFNEITLNLEKISSDIREGRSLGQEMELAAEIQRDVLPKIAPEMMGLEIVARSKSARQIGGDAFDFIKKGHNDFILIGDATGHGIPAALVMMMVSTLMRTYIESGFSAAEAMLRTNEFLFEKISANRFMTVVVLRWDEEAKKMYWTGAGHETILVYRKKSGIVESVKTGGIALRMVRNIENLVVEREIPDLEIGDALLLYSDGITEAKHQHTGEMYGVSRLIRSFERAATLPTADLIFERVSDDFSAYVGNYLQNDDITMIVLQRGGEQGQGANISLCLPEAGVSHSVGRWSW